MRITHSTPVAARYRYDLPHVRDVSSALLRDVVAPNCPREPLESDDTAIEQHWDMDVKMYCI